jgi:MFS family permease
MGFSSIRAQGLSAPPYLAAFIVTVTACYLSDKRGDRSMFMIPLALIGFAGYLILALATSTAVRYFAVYLCA